MSSRFSIAKRQPVMRPTAVQSWSAVLVAVAIACGVFAAAFWREMAGAVNVWLGSTAYNHCFLVLPLVAVLLWLRRSTIAALQPRPSLWALALIPPLSAVWLLAAATEILEAQQLAIVAMFEVLLLAVLGWRVWRALLGPLLFLFFLVPFGESLVPALQHFTTAFTVRGLQILGIPVFSDGFMIQIPEGSFEVAEACAGLRFLIASIVFGCFFSTVLYRSTLRRLIFIGLSIIVPIVANGLRALGLLLLAHLEGSASAVETDHILYGWLFFTLVTFILIGIGLSFADRSDAVPTKATALEPTSKFRIGTTMAAGLVLALAGPAYLIYVDQAEEGVGASAWMASPPDGWLREADGRTEWHPTIDGASSVSLQTYRLDTSAVTELVARYRLSYPGSRFTKMNSQSFSSDGWHVVKTGSVGRPSGNATIAVNTLVLRNQFHQRLVWWFYAVANEATGSTVKAKLLQARSMVLKPHRPGTIIAISTDADNLETASAALGRFLDAIPAWRDSTHGARVGALIPPLGMLGPPLLPMAADTAGFSS
jgi:exosortase A